MSPADSAGKTALPPLPIMRLDKTVGSHPPSNRDSDKSGSFQQVTLKLIASPGEAPWSISSVLTSWN